MTAASNVLRVQELCDYIASFLHESRTDLKTCALTCSTLTSSAQRHLFHDIILNRDILDVDAFSFRPRFDEGDTCRRFCSVLQATPHLVPFVRRLRASLEEDVVEQLRKVDFPNLQDIVFHSKDGGQPT
ncbi:hypothetical protein C8R44DRAFT_985518 [Mycena epipterygia]|nr:hypothetical protein C8R44DRAFT_985518 [Mycena epipterygia]